MRKSPFSTPRGNGRPGFSWNSSGSPGRGYGRPKNNQFYSPNRSQNSSQSFGDDFIPFDSNTSSSSDRKSGGNWSSSSSGSWLTPTRGNHRQSSSPYNNYGNNGSRRENHQQSPYYNDRRNSFQGNRKSFQRGNSQRKIDISRYMDMRSFLEDPWAELSRKYHNNGHFDDSTNENLSDLSFNSSILDAVRLDESFDDGNLTNTERSSQEAINDSCIESDCSVLPPTSQESDVASPDNSLEHRTSRDSKD